MDGGASRILAGSAPEPLLAGPVHEEHGLACRLSTRPVMRRAHRHDDVELALAVGGWVEHEHAGRGVRVDDGTLVVAWGALPHRVSAAADGAAVRWLTVPLADALEWDVEGRLTAALLRGERWVLPGRSADAARFAGWAADLAGGVPARARAARLEARALLERLSVTAPAPVDDDTGDDDPAPETAGDRHARRVAEMAAFVAARFREPVGVTEVAAAAHLHPATATAAFRAVTGTTPGAFLLRCRLAEAQRLLLVTGADVDAVARRAGFGSTSSFYAAFTREVGEPPAACRRRRLARRDLV
ncbi:transcriptional regulator, AraC family [Geodermatophilus saharensis]|uniref:Transcriptional regulator, AraC family n=1 Tax=Geodermatophilus saharensis TaxID=1137994 RepID=A0A239DJT2_9ACTN|nr:AraC family transcriptional regulator [Geodermatophilus saharensis]SNS32108.1 transcriptional regulator, AraC family [Geodermatophilus saharensis]